MADFTEQQIARALESLPPAPSAWIEAAKQIPPMRAEIDDIVARAKADLEYRRSVITALEKALAQPPAAERPRLEELRSRISELES